MSKYVCGFKCREDIAAEYGGEYGFKYERNKFKPSSLRKEFPQAYKILDDLRGAKIYLAWYGYGSYEGCSLVIYEKDGTLFEVNGSHCSCSGLEGQWQPEETSWEAIKKREIYGYFEGAVEAQTILQNLANKNLKAATIQ